GEGIECGGPRGEDCQEVYPDETILHLEAYPDDRSEFKGWLIDGEPQQGAIAIRKDITVTGIFDKIPYPEFEIVSTRPSPVVYSYENLTYPLYDTTWQVIGALRELQREEGFQWDVTIWDKAHFTMPMINALTVPTQSDKLVAYGEAFRSPVIEQTRSDLFFYSLDGTLLKFVETDLGGDRNAAMINNTGELWIAGIPGKPMYDKAPVLKRYASDGTLLWEQPLPEYEPRRLVFSPNNRYAALTLLQKSQKLGPDLTVLRMYEEDGAVVYEKELPPFFYGVEFISDQRVLFHTGSRWELYMLENWDTPFVSGRFAGNPFGAYPIIVFPSENCFIVRTAVDENGVTDYHIEAIHQETGEILSERLFEGDSVQELEFYRITKQGSFEMLLNGNTIMELRMPK
ncbi:MAG: hypothetical protein GY790_22560, partial [Bacteroidetes bacterium]|nr:hypothetical protein [Bacteroidota bacterium]